MIKDSGLWSEVEKLRDGLEDLFKTGLGYAGRTPAYRLQAKPEEYVVSMELPGVPKNAVSVSFQDGQVLVAGAKPAPVGAEGELLRDETWSGTFERTVPLPTEVDGGNIQAKYQDGVLVIRIPRLAKEKARTVNID